MITRRMMTYHSMQHRAVDHDYTRPGIYHITLHVADALGQPLGAVVGDPDAPDGSADAPRTALSPLGEMVEHELLHSIRARYPMVTIDTYVIMPEHIHFLLEVQDRLLSPQGKKVPLGQVIAGFKKGCNRRFWEMTGLMADNRDGETVTHTTPASGAPLLGGDVPGGPASGVPLLGSDVPGGPASGVPLLGGDVPGGPASGAPLLGGDVPGGPASGVPLLGVSVPGGSPAGHKISSSASSGRPSLFAPGYCDVMPVDAKQLATQRAYILNNPRSRRLRMQHPDRLRPLRGGIDTALSPAALRGYLERECPPHLVAPDILALLFSQLLLSPDGRITCDTFGDRRLLSRRLLPVVCHRRDRSRFATQKGRCLEEAARGAVLVSARIARGEQDIMDETANRGFPVVLIADNGFTDRYHPSASRMSLCAEGRLLLVTPWRYEYRRKDDSITVAACKTMNCN